METKAPGRIRRLAGFAKRHPVASSVAGAVGVGLFVFLIVWFAPHKLFIDETVDEAAPLFVDTNTSSVIASGEFRSLDHETKGKATLVRGAGGAVVLRLEGFSTSNGPDLRVYLSEIPASAGSRAYGERFVDLGALKGNVGSQNYSIPAGTDLSKYASAVIWCRRFTVGFGVAPLFA